MYIRMCLRVRQCYSAGRSCDFQPGDREHDVTLHMQLLMLMILHYICHYICR